MKRLVAIAMVVLIAGGAVASFAASAGATVLCRDTPDVNGKCLMVPGDYAVGQVVKASAAKSTFTVVPKLGSSAENVVCKTAMELKLGTTGGGAGTNVTGNVENLSFTSCTREKTGFGCTATVVGTPPATFAIAWTSAGNGNFSTSSITIQVTCPNVLACVFKAAPTVPMTGSGTTPQITVSQVKFQQEEPKGFTECPSSSQWDATYSIESPTPLWVANQMA